MICSNHWRKPSVYRLLPALIEKSSFINSVMLRESCWPSQCGMEDWAYPSHPGLPAISSEPSEVAASFVNLILTHNPSYPKQVQLEQRQVKARCRNDSRSDIAKEADTLKSGLPKAKQLAVEQPSEKAASSWLTTIHLLKYGFTHHKQAFRDALCLRFCWSPARLASHCPCGQPFRVSHAVVPRVPCSPSAIMPSEMQLHISSQTFIQT